MDQKTFLIKLESLGELRRSLPGQARDDVAYEDQKFVPNDQRKVCEDCGEVVKNRTLIYDVKFNYRGEAYWRTRCQVKDCKLNWSKLHL
jgi:hypothetical protein